MTAKRESPFPSTSIGRAQGANMSRTASFETLSAHPLLSTAASPSSVSTAQDSHTAPKYVPYTPKHRVASPVTSTTGTVTVDSSVPASSPQHHGAATTKLQLMNLKAVAQNVGLDTTSVGWAMLEKVVYESDHSIEWTEIWASLTTGKASLLLPLEQSSGHEKITPGFVKDHVVLCDASSRDNAPIVTLSGFRGILTDDKLAFRSSLFPASKSFQDILGTFSRSSALAALPPLEISPSLSPPYPSFSVPSYVPALPLPPRPVGLNKPPLPPRPNSRPSTTHSSSRLSNTFTSLFGKSTPPTGPSASPMPPQPDNENVVDISAFTIDRRIIGKDVGKAINVALKNEIEELLSGLPSWVIVRVHDFTRGMYPLVKAPKSTASSTGGGASLYVTNNLQETPAGASERFQDFYELLEQDLRLEGSPLVNRHPDGKGQSEGDPEQWVQHKLESESTIREVLETVECVVCSLFYDRIYLQSTSDDASHDEALSSRVAALNMLDLGLEHLDVHVGDAGPELDLVVKACGDKLTQLDTSSTSPAGKAAILVEAHKIIVEGLSRLPPIRLKSEAELEGGKAVLDRKKNKLDATLTSPELNAPLLFQLSPTNDVHVPNSLVDVMSLDSIPGLVIPEDEEDTTVNNPTSSPLVQATTGPASSPQQPPSPLVHPTTSTPVSGDILLPLLIFSVVKANPPHLVSHLLYTQRFRNQSVGGEESYCLINLMAVAEFLENVDLAALGLADSENKVLSAATLTPIPINRTPITAESASSAPDGPGSLRGRVEQQVDAIAGSANKVISGVVGSSFGVLRLLLPGSQDNATAPAATSTSTVEAGGTQNATWSGVRPGFGLLGRETGFSFAASIAASLPGASGRAKSAQSLVEESGQPLLDVSRPPSVKSGGGGGSGGYRDDDEGEESASEKSGEGGENEKGEEDGSGGGGGGAEGEGEHDSRSIRSFENMLNGKGRERKGVGTRKSLSDRLAHMSGLTRLQSREQQHQDLASLKGSPPSRRSSLLPLPPLPSTRVDNYTPGSSRPQSPSGAAVVRIAPPNQRFLECSEGDIRVSEVGELLKEYRRVVDGLRSVGGFEE